AELQAKVDPRAEWAQIYLESWRINRDFYYDEKMHGDDWAASYEKYKPFIEHINHRGDLSYVLSMLIGELVSGHSRTGGGDYPDSKPVSVGLLGADFEVEDGRYRIARILTGENWNPTLRAPLSAPGIDAAEGDYLLEVNGVAIESERNLFSYFEGTAGKQTSLKLSESASGRNARTITVVPVGSERALRSRAWVEGNRRKVDELSDGRLAYVYLPNTGTVGYAYFNRYYFAQQQKMGAVIDERFNGGGSIADYIVDVLDRKLTSQWATRDGKPGPCGPLTQG
ncbi:MAG: PDZ domain-containing protein, partial [SAR324 cluster bacterium]|nr:PDZ domain-containing protein [SAR324 cluster bacterium]